MTPSDHIAAAERYLDLLTEIAEGPHPPASVLADAGLLHAHLAVAKQATAPRGELVEFRGPQQRHRGHR